MRRFKHNMPTDYLDFVEEISMGQSQTSYLIEPNSTGANGQSTFEESLSFVEEYLHLRRDLHGLKNYKILEEKPDFYKANFEFHGRKYEMVFFEASYLMEQSVCYKLVFKKINKEIKAA